MANTEYVLYPNALDGYATLPLRKNLVHEIRAEDYNRLRNAIIAIEQELGIQPSGMFATIRARLDDVANASSLIESHLADTLDAHDASAISILDTADNYVSGDVEGALSELSAVLPAALDFIGEDDTSIANSGIPDFYTSSGDLHVYNTSTGGTDIAKTQPIDITGFYIIEVGDSNGAGTAELRMSNHSPATIEWKAPGDSSFGASVDISSLSDGDIATISSSTTTKRIRIARNSDSFPVVSPKTETFDVIRMAAQTGAYSYTGTGITSSTKITRAAAGDSATTRNQFTINGMVFPADKGTLVLQRKLRAGSSEFVPIAILDLGANFDESLRTTNQPVYNPSLSGTDSILLYDRYPARPDYDTLSTDSDGNAIYDNFSLESTFSPYQVAKYKIPISNSTVANATLESPTGITASEIESKVSSYRLVHYRTGITDFIGEPSSSDIFSISDSVGDVNDGDSTVRMSNLYSDSSATHPTIEAFVFRPELDAEVTTKTISGVNYYNSSSDLFDIEIKSNTDLFANAYLEDGILQFESSVFTFPGESDGYGTSVDVTKLLDDGYVEYSDSNLPAFGDYAFYLSNLTINSSNRAYPATNSFSTRGHVAASFNDPFGTGGATDSYGIVSDGTILRLLVNAYSTSRATDTQEWFTDESRRVGTSEVFDFNLDVDQFTGAGTNGTLDSWTSSSALSAGELQCGGVFVDGYTDVPGLVYPQDDYSTSDVRPTQTAAADYSAAAGARTYQRLFSLGKSTTGGMLRIVSEGESDISFNDISYTNSTRSVKIEVKIPGPDGNATGWMDLGRTFQTNATDDGDGALVGPVLGGSGDFTVPFTFGIKDTGATGNLMAVRITFAPTDGGTNVADAKTKILSSIELLES